MPKTIRITMEASARAESLAHTGNHIVNASKDPVDHVLPSPHLHPEAKQRSARLPGKGKTGLAVEEFNFEQTKQLP